MSGNNLNNTGIWTMLGVATNVLRFSPVCPLMEYCGCILTNCSTHYNYTKPKGKYEMEMGELHRDSPLSAIYCFI